MAIFRFISKVVSVVFLLFFFFLFFSLLTRICTETAPSLNVIKQLPFMIHGSNLGLTVDQVLIYQRNLLQWLECTCM